MPIPFKIQTGSSTAWKRTLYIMFFAQMISMIGFSSVFPFLPLYVKSLGTVTSMSADFCVGLVYSGQAFAMMIASPIWGAIADRWGRKLMVERAMFGGAVILAMMAFVRSAEELVLLRMIQGLISGVMGATNALVAATAPRGRTGYAMGLMQVAMGLGLGLGPVIGGMVADAYGYRTAFYITAALLASAGVVVFLGVDEQFVARESTLKSHFHIFGTWKRVLSSQGVPLIYILRFINQMGRIIYIPILPLFIISLIDNPGRVNGFTGLVIGISSASTAFFSIFLGRIGDQRGHRRIVIPCLLCSALLFLIQSMVGAGWQLLILQLFYGVALGGIITGISTLLADYSQPGDEGAVYGLDSSITSGARMIGPMLGVAISAYIGIRMVFGAAALLYLVAGVLAVIGLPRPSIPTKI